MSIIEFPKKPEPWKTPQADFEIDAVSFVGESAAAVDLVKQLQSCASPFIRAAIIACACGAEDVPFLLRIAERRKGDLLSPNPPGANGTDVFHVCGCVPR